MHSHFRNMTDYTPTIGLEIHAELKTASKMFCDSPNPSSSENVTDEGAVAPNTFVCPVCMAHPGTLPVINRAAVKHILKLGVAVGGNCADFTEFDRKNYFYPDIPKGYQISQYAYPLVSGGSINDVELTRVHLEEDTAKSTHDKGEYSLVDFNRAGVPLMELVTEPVIRSGEQAAAFAKELQLLLRYLGAGDANMEKGQMRVEANISVSPDAERFGTKVEVKNLNSFRAVQDAIAAEIERHTAAYEAGDTITQETRGWDENTGTTFSQREKEESHDYRYFPDPDLPKLRISEISGFDDASLRAALPELPWERRARYRDELGLAEKTAEIFVGAPAWAAYFETVRSHVQEDDELCRLATNYITSDFIGLIKNDDSVERFDELDPAEVITPERFADMIRLAADGTLSSRGTKDLLGILYTTDGDPKELATEHGLIQQNDEGTLQGVIDEILTENPSVVADYKNGNESVLQFLVGQGMKKTQGSANPQKLQELLTAALTDTK